MKKRILKALLLALSLLTITFAFASCGQKPISTITVVYHDGSTQKVNIYSETLMDDLEGSRPFGYEYAGIYSEPNGQGIKYTGSWGLLSEGIIPADGSVVYANYRKLFKEGTYFCLLLVYSRPIENGQMVSIFKEENVYIHFGENLADVLPKDPQPDEEGCEFMGWYIDNRANFITDSNANPLKQYEEQYKVFNPYEFPFEDFSYITGAREGDFLLVLYGYYDKKSYEFDISYPDREETVQYVGARKYSDFAPPEIDGKKFLGFSDTPNGETIFDNDAYITQNIPLYAIYADKVNITFKDADGNQIKTEEYFYYNDSTSVSLPEAEAKEGHDFIGWKFEDAYVSNALFTELVLSPEIDGQTIVPVYEPKTYKITYFVQGTQMELRQQSYTYGVPLTLESQNAEALGIQHYFFDGWFANAECTGESVTEIEAGRCGDITLYAKLRPEHFSLYFNPNGGTVAGSVMGVDYGSRPFTVIPKRNNYIFLGWYYNDNQIFDAEGMSVDNFEIGKMGLVSSDFESGYLTLDARWEKIGYKVSFVADGSTVNEQKVHSGACAELPESPTKTGYNFVGWYIGVSEVNPAEYEIKKDTVFTAKFEKKTYEIRLYHNDGTENFTPVRYSYGDTTVSFTAPVLDGYEFTGWCISPEPDSLLGITTTGAMWQTFEWYNDDGISLYARWYIK